MIQNRRNEHLAILSQQHWAPLQPVVVHHDPTADLEYEPDAALRRRKGNGREGLVVAHSNSHGLCFCVYFDDHTIAWYEPQELSDLPTLEDRPIGKRASFLQP